ncbi:hypothetical protein MBLNU230_g3230t1 [Neophaeotheca triangularis]
MAAVAPPATPQRPLPGQFLNTPAPAQPSIFSQNAQAARQPYQQPQTQQNGSAPQPQAPSMAERAARVINDTLSYEARSIELENYAGNGLSAEYEQPTNPAWEPFQKLRSYDLPPKLLEQANYASTSMKLGLFAPLEHGWMSMDNCIYLWDYKSPNPEIIGWEEANGAITAVKLVKPKPGVFVPAIEHLIVIATNREISLLGVAVQTTATGAKQISLYNTRMSLDVRAVGGIGPIDSSAITGRIFFASQTVPHIFEFYYQQEEGWFSGKTRLINHSQSGGSSLSALIPFGNQGNAAIFSKLVVDDSRNLIFTLKDHTKQRITEVQSWAIGSAGDKLASQKSQSYANLINQASTHNFAPDLLAPHCNVKLVDIDVVPAEEARATMLVAITNTGCRLHIDLPPGAPSFQIRHVRFPPPGSQASAPSQTTMHGNTGMDMKSLMLDNTHDALRLPPGLFFDFISDAADPNRDTMFCSAPDYARINSHRPPPNSTFYPEFGQWMRLPARMQSVVVLSNDSRAVNTPQGFGNEMAIQFDKPSTELGIVTTTGIETIRRRRLVDTFAALMRHGSTDTEGLEGDIKKFVSNYGRAETAASALAVVCGQGVDVTSDLRVASVTEPEVLERARRVFLEQGGHPEYNPNMVVDNSISPIDGVRPSPRHDGMALYISRLVRSVWSAHVIREVVTPTAGAQVVPFVSLSKLKEVQRNLNSISDFIERNKSFIDGLAGPQALGQAGSRQGEIALQGEHRAMRSLCQLVENMVEGINFVLVLFEDKVEEILMALPDESKGKLKNLTFEGLFVSQQGRDLAKELVKAIVNRSIVNGSNVDTVADSLRRRCGSFCSADDVVIFKAQEQLKRASEAGASTESGRILLNESQRLFQKVASSLSIEHLEWAISRYIDMAFYAGAIQLCIVVAAARDKAKSAQAWLKDGRPQEDSRKAAFDARDSCYQLAFRVIENLDASTASSPESVDGHFTVAAKRRNEAYDIINSTDDVVFQTALYDWYMSIGQSDRLLEIDSPFVVDYLRRKSGESRPFADLLWRYFAHNNAYPEAAAVQLELAKGFYSLTLEERIGYLSRARTNANTRQSALVESRQSRQQLLREISDLLEAANIQDDILQRMKSEGRLVGERRTQVLAQLDGPIKSIADLFNEYADQASYHDICILIYAAADHRNPADIAESWRSLIAAKNDEARYLKHGQSYEMVGETVRSLGRRLNTGDAIFPINILLPTLEEYALEAAPEMQPPPSWAIDIFLELEIPFETLLPVLEQTYYSNEPPFQGKNRKIPAGDMVYLIKRWLENSEKRGEHMLFGSEENAVTAQDCLQSLLRTGDLENNRRHEAELLVQQIAMALR